MPVAHFQDNQKLLQTFTGVSWWRWRNYWGLRIISSNHVSLAQTIRVTSEVFRGRDWEKDCGQRKSITIKKKKRAVVVCHELKRMINSTLGTRGPNTSNEETQNKLKLALVLRIGRC